MSIESVNIYVSDDTLAGDPVEGVIVRIFDTSGTTFLMQATTDDDGLAGFSLTAPANYQVRFFKEQFSIRQPQSFAVVEAPIAPIVNDFNVSGHVYTPPEAVHPRLCRCSGFFRRPDNSAAVGHDVHFIAQFDPLLFEGAAMLTERLHHRTDETGYMQIDLVRFGQYAVTVEGFEDCQRIITIPDAPSVNLPDLIFPVVDAIDFDPPGPWAIGLGVENDFTITPTVRTSDGRVLPGTALRDVYWTTSNPNGVAVLATNAVLVLRGFVAGTYELRAVRADQSIVRLPNPPIEGVPVVVTVS